MSTAKQTTPTAAGPQDEARALAPVAVATLLQAPLQPITVRLRRLVEERNAKGAECSELQQRRDCYSAAWEASHLAHRTHVQAAIAAAGEPDDSVPAPDGAAYAAKFDATNNLIDALTAEIARLDAQIAAAEVSQRGAAAAALSDEATVCVARIQETLDHLGPLIFRAMAVERVAQEHGKPERGFWANLHTRYGSAADLLEGFIAFDWPKYPDVIKPSWLTEAGLTRGRLLDLVGEAAAELRTTVANLLAEDPR